MPFDTQSNTRAGLLPKLAGADLTGKEGRLVKLTNAGAVVLPAAITDHCPFVLVRGNTQGGVCDVLPLGGDRNVRIRGNGVIAAGAPVVLAAIAGDDAGKIRAVPVGAGTYRGIGICEEVAATVDEQLVLVRPHPVGDIVVT